MPQRIEEHGELAQMLERCLDYADRLDLAYVAVRIAEALDSLQTALSGKT